MHIKMMRGVQQDDVWAAADALIAEGLRPTIERVRLKMGRGSPNTVSPLLEAWFATLGPRLGVKEPKEEKGSLPPAVQQASAKLWEVALVLAYKEVEMATMGAKQALEEERTIFESSVAEFLHQEAVFAERQAAAERALVVAKDQISDLCARLQESKTLLAERDHEIESTQSRLSAVEQQRDAERHRMEEESRRHTDERGRAEQRAAANERRLLQDIDRERQEAKLAKAAASNAEQRAKEFCTQLELDKRLLANKLLNSETEFRSIQQVLVSTQERARELRTLLDAQAAANATTLKQLDLLIANQATQKFANAVKRTRISKRSTSRNSGIISE